MDTTRTELHSLEIAARNIERSIGYDNAAPMPFDVMNVSAQTGSTSSGTSDNDYPSLSQLPPAFNNIVQIKTSSKVPLPPEILERFNHIQCHSMMGLFTEINRAWLTIDSDIYIWTYEEGGDVAYYDGLNETIVCVGLVSPKPGVFHTFIKHLLVLVTATDIVVLGVTFMAGPNDTIDEIQLVPDPVFTIPTDGSTITTIVGSVSGRMFLGSKDGCLYEISYQAESSWFGKRCKKLNHSTNALSFLMPSFLNAALSEDDAIIQISIDDSRHILYVLTEKGSIWLYDLGETGHSLSKVTTLSQSSLVQQAVITVKTLDSENFRPIVNISAVEARESSYINLVAVSQTGTRFYFSVSSLSNLQPNQRPYTLTLVHVRLPPGYSATMTTRPRMVHMANYRDSNLMLLSTVNEKDVLWCVSSDMFPLSTMFMEAYTTVALDGPAWAMAEVCEEKAIIQPHPFIQQPSLAVRQHFVSLRKYVVLTAQGAHIFFKLRPVDFLKQLLIDCHGPDNETVRTYFMIQKEDQACATSLILACLENIQTMEVSEWATQAFFIYGGEPKLAPPAVYNQTNPFSPSSSFLPNIMSTPVTPHLQIKQQQLQPQLQSTHPIDASQSSTFANYSPFIYSPKHNGLYLYLGRILRPIWNMPCVEKLQTDIGNKIYLTSTLIAEECMWILSYLTSLRVFLQKNTRLTICNSITDQTTMHSSFGMNQQTLNNTRLNQTLQDAQLEERQSLDAFKNFVNHSCQVMGLWKILCEHQFHILVESLPDHLQQMLHNTLFRDLILYGHEVCIGFINVLISSYLADNALIDSISSKLREVCPDLYKNEDAACSKVYEMLKTAKSVQNKDEKEELVSSALYLCKSVAPNINLHEICQHFASLNAYHAVTELCVTCAKKIDPDNVAEYYYKSNNDTAQQDSYNFYAKRIKIYKEILLMLDTLSAQISNVKVHDSQLGTEIQNMSIQQDKIEIIRRVISDILQYPDELLHVATYEWMMAKQMDGDLIKSPQPSLEKYLVKVSQQSQDNIAALNLLWKYYESNKDHAAAAKILYNMACKTGNMLTLKDRLGYLARAAMCMRADSVGYAPHFGVFLKDLEDKLDIAKVQEQILDAIINLQGLLPNADEAINALNSCLYDLTQLYEQFTDPFNLWECKLAIVDCAGYTDISLIEGIWLQVIEGQLKRSSGTADDKLTQILNKIMSLIRRYKFSTTTNIPLDYIVHQLEVLSMKLKANPTIIPSTLCAEISMENIVRIYNNIIGSLSTDRFWAYESNEFHIAQAFAELVNNFLYHENQYDHHLRTKIVALCEDAIAKLLSNLYSKPNAGDLINILKNIQSRLARC